MINYGSDKSLDVGSHWIATSYEKCNCRAHQEDPETINELVSEQYSYNCKVMEETQQLTKRLHERDQKGMSFITDCPTVITVCNGRTPLMRL